MVGIIFAIAVSIIWFWIGYEMYNSITTKGDDEFADGMGRDEYGNPISKD